MLRVRRLILYLILGLVSAALYYSWRNHMLPSDVQKFISNYGLHLLGCFAFTLYIGGLWYTMSGGEHYVLVITTLICSVLVTLNEGAQYYQPGRVVDKYDVLAQMIGCLLAYGVILIIGPFAEAPEFKKDLGRA